MIEKRKSTSLGERLMGLLILIALIGISVWIFNRQFTFNSAITATLPDTAKIIEPNALQKNLLNLEVLTPTGFKTTDPTETFDSNTLFEKIDGKADLYLSAGFTGLTCQRFTTTNSSAWMEAFIYDMGTPRQAFAVYSIQRREDAVKKELTDFAYSTANAMYFTHGRYYVEIVASTVNENTSRGMTGFAQAFIKNIPGSSLNLREQTLFPPDHAIMESAILFIGDGFGFEPFDNLLTTHYRLGTTEVTGFITLRKSPADAVDLTTAYCAFLIDNGGTYENPPSGIPGANVYNLFGTYEIVFNIGKVVAGVHQAETREAADWLAAAMYHRISESEQW